MSSRQTISATQRNSKTGRTPMTASSATHAVIVKITWTSAPMVKVQARQAFKLECQIVSVIRGQYTIVRQSAQMDIAAGEILHFVSAEGRPGWYYLVQTIAGKSHCSCPMAKFHQSCEHLHAVQVHCEAAERAEFARAGADARIELVEVERDGSIYPMYRIVSPTHQGKLHYTWCEDHTINRFPAESHAVEERASNRFQDDGKAVAVMAGRAA